MMESPYLSRVRLRHDASVRALLPLLLGDHGSGEGRSQHPGHHLVWSLFADGSERRRDFLWREMERGTFLILSERQPRDRHALFEVAEPKPFVPVLAAGDRLRFSLRANPVVRRRVAPHLRSTKHDVVIDALRMHSVGERAEHRLAVIREQGLAWLERQSRSAGFEVSVDDVGIDGYQQHRVSRRGSAPPMSFSTLDFDGMLVVREPAAFLSAVMRGFGASKAYGCGLMLIRRA